MIITRSITWHVPTSLILHTLSIEVSTRVSSIIQNQTRAFRRPGDEAATEEDSITRGGAASVRAADPVSVSVDDKLSWSRPGDDQAIADGALKVVKNPLGSSQVSLTRIMHVKADLLDSICNVRASEHQVLEGTYKIAVGSRIIHRRASICGDLGTSVNGGRAGIAATHTMAVHNVQGVLPL